MSYFVQITFDLKDVAGRTDIYSGIDRELKKIDFSKYFVGRKNIPRKLPSNTFVAEFDTEEFEKTTQLVKYVSKKLSTIFEDYAVHGNYFISAGKRWACKKGNF